MTREPLTIARLRDAYKWAREVTNDRILGSVEADIIDAVGELLAIRASAHPESCDNCGHASDCALHDSANPAPCDCKQVPDWICEEHPHKVWPHDDCAGPGMPGSNIFRLWQESAGGRET